MSKKRRWIFAIAVALAWIIVLTLAAVFLLPKLLGQTPVEKVDRSAEKTVRLVMEGVISGGTEEAVLLATDGSAAPVSPSTGLAAMISAKIEYEIQSVQTEEDSGVARLRITAPDTLTLVTRAIEGMESLDEALLEQRVRQMLDEEYATLEYEVTVELVKVENSWCLVTNDQFADAITGGLLSGYAQLRQNIIDALAGGKVE